jgi:uncharacterized membrane protein YgcG
MRIRRSYPLLGAASVALGGLPGCSTDPVFFHDTLSRQDGASDVTADSGGSEAAPIAGYPAPHGELPRVESFGGPVLRAPRVVPVFFAADPSQSQIEQFLMELSSSAYWTATTSEYGVGPLAVAPSIVVSDPALSVITTGQALDWLVGHLDGSHPEWPPIDVNNVYVVFYPEATTITETIGATTFGTSCKDFGAYHDQGIPSVDAVTGGDGGGGDGDDGGGDEGGGGGGGGEGGGGGDESGSAEDAVAGGAGADAVDSARDAAAGLARPTGPSFVYAVIPRCASFNGQTGLDSLTAATSHEIVEAVTDPLPRTDPAYSTVDFDHLAWDLALGGSELGDMCVAAESSDRIYRRLVGDFMVQRTWSNQAAEVGQDPCAPAIADVYFGAAPEFDETVLIPSPGRDPNLPYLTTTGESLAVGQSRTITVRLFSTGPISDWLVQPDELLPASSATHTLRFAWDRTSAGAPTGVATGHNGDVFQLTITRTAPAPSAPTVFTLFSSSGTRSPTYSTWFGVVN